MKHARMRPLVQPTSHRMSWPNVWIMQGIASGVQPYMKQATELVERYKQCPAVAYVSVVYEHIPGNLID
jgi:hypothetical protein